ncbi:MAG: MBL fold metallo-hydrolase [Oscillospiraceae bacterium]|jgi:L-ascorbate metabolism protein UlaG (beta-lactamase superfamily)|nr:MBL fold metallo-hydrolase [Oscillospiraceae bacterium]
MPKLLFQGHGSYRFTTDDGRVVYVDPFSGKGYDKPADMVLITHQHHDHNKISLITQKDTCTVITNAEALAGGEYKTFDIDGVKIEATEAYNSHHNKAECVGFILTIDGVAVYCSGDTGVTEQMKTFADRQLDYAIFNTDNMFTIPFEQSAEIAAVIGAKHNIPVHLAPIELFARGKAKKWAAPNKLILEPGQEIDL